MLSALQQATQQLKSSCIYAINIHYISRGCPLSWIFYICKIYHMHSFYWRVQTATVPCHSQELLLFLSVMYFFLPPFSTNYSSILSHLILPSVSWSTSQFCCSQVPKIPFGNSIFFHSLYMPKPNLT